MPFLFFMTFKRINLVSALSLILTIYNASSASVPNSTTPVSRDNKDASCYSASMTTN